MNSLCVHRIIWVRFAWKWDDARVNNERVSRFNNNRYGSSEYNLNVKYTGLGHFIIRLNQVVIAGFSVKSEKCLV